VCTEWITDFTISFKGSDVYEELNGLDWQEVVPREILANVLVEMSAEFVLLLDLHDEFKEYIYIYIHTQGLSKRFEHLLLWAPRSPDLTTCDFFLWGYVKDNAYKPQTARSNSSCGANHWRGTSYLAVSRS
jgi:hypothetical protein